MIFLVILLFLDIDYAAVLLSQLTYEGVLDETFGINSGKVLINFILFYFKCYFLCILHFLYFLYFYCEGRITFPKEVTHKEPMKFALNNSDMVS